MTLYADIDSTFFAHSLVGPISLVSALAAAVYSRDRDLYDSRVQGRARQGGRVGLAPLTASSVGRPVPRAR